MKLTEADIKQIYFHCNNKSPTGIYHNPEDDLDIVEFATKIAEYVELRVAQEAKREEHKRCVKIVSDANPTIGKLLLAQRQYVE